MPRDGAGNYSVPYPDFQPGTVIDQSQIDANFGDIASAISQSVARNGETIPTQALPMGGRNHTGVADATAADQYASAAQVQRSSITWGGTTTGTGAAYFATLSPAYTGTYANGMRVQFRAHAACAASPSLNVNALGAKTIGYLSRGAVADLPAGMIALGQVVEVCFDLTSNRWLLLSPSAYAPGFYDLGQSVNGSAQSTVTFALPAAFATFQLRISGTAPGSDAAPFLRFSYDGGVSYTSSPFDYGFSFSTVAISSVTGSTATSSIVQLGAVASGNVFGTVDFAAGSPTRGTFALTCYQPGPVLSFSSGGFNGPTAMATHVLFGFNGTTVGAHRIQLLGSVAA